MQRALTKTLSTAASPACVALRSWYTLDDLGYEGQVQEDGYARAPAPASEAAMMRAYKKSGKTLFC